MSIISQFLNSEEGYSLLLNSIYFIPLLFFLIAIAILFYASRIGKYKDRNKSKHKRRPDNDENKKVISKYRFSLTLKNFFRVLFVVLVASALEFSLIGMIKTWYLGVETGIVAILLPVGILTTLKKRSDDKYLNDFPEVIQKLSDCLKSSNSLRNALIETAKELDNNKIATDIKNLSIAWEERKLKEGLKKFYKSSGYNDYVFQLVGLLEYYSDTGGDLQPQLKRIKHNAQRTRARRRKKKYELVIPKILAIICIICVPLSVKFSQSVTLGYVNDYFTTPAGQNYLAFSMLYSVIALLIILFVEHV